MSLFNLPNHKSSIQSATYIWLCNSNNKPRHVCTYRYIHIHTHTYTHVIISMGFSGLCALQSDTIWREQQDYIISLLSGIRYFQLLPYSKMVTTAGCSVAPIIFDLADF